MRDRYNEVTSDGSVIHIHILECTVTRAHTHKHRDTQHSLYVHTHPRNTMPILFLLSAECVEKKGRGHAIEPRRYNSGSYHTLPSHSSTDKEGKGYICKGSYYVGKEEKQVLKANNAT